MIILIFSVIIVHTQMEYRPTLPLGTLLLRSILCLNLTNYNRLCFYPKIFIPNAHAQKEHLIMREAREKNGDFVLG